MVILVGFIVYIGTVLVWYDIDLIVPSSVQKLVHVTFNTITVYYKLRDYNPV